MMIKNALYLGISDVIPPLGVGLGIFKNPVVNILDFTPINEMLQIFDDASVYGIEIIIEDGKFYYLE